MQWSLQTCSISVTNGSLSCELPLSLHCLACQMLVWPNIFMHGYCYHCSPKQIAGTDQERNFWYFWLATKAIMPAVLVKCAELAFVPIIAMWLADLISGHLVFRLRTLTVPLFLLLLKPGNSSWPPHVFSKPHSPAPTLPLAFICNITCGAGSNTAGSCSWTSGLSPLNIS